MAVKECGVEEAVGSAEALTVVVYVLIRVASRKVGWRMQSGCEGAEQIDPRAAELLRFGWGMRRV